MQQDETIVLLDDDEDTVDVLAEFLRQEGYTVEGYADVRQGLERLRRPPAPCLAIMDYRLGELQGPDVARAVRFTWPDLPMVLLTSLPRDLIDREALGKLGIHDVLVKPPTIDTLIRAVAAALGNRCRKRRS